MIKKLMILKNHEFLRIKFHFCFSVRGFCLGQSDVCFSPAWRSVAASLVSSVLCVIRSWSLGFAQRQLSLGIDFWVYTIKIGAKLCAVTPVQENWHRIGLVWQWEQGWARTNVGLLLLLFKERKCFGVGFFCLVGVFLVFLRNEGVAGLKHSQWVLSDSGC